jgi:hypothetical protein
MSRPAFLLSPTDMKTHATLRQARRAIGSHSHIRFPEYVLRRTRSTPCSAPAFASDPLSPRHGHCWRACGAAGGHWGAGGHDAEATPTAVLPLALGFLRTCDGAGEGDET